MQTLYGDLEIFSFVSERFILIEKLPKTYFF